MKFAVITDVHGNAPALDAVLRAIDEVRDVEHIYVLGDMIAIGPNTNEVLDVLFSREDVSMITGNHDEAVLALVYGDTYPESHAHAKSHHKWVADRLHPQYAKALKQLPRVIEEEIDEQRLYFVHYHIRPEKWRAPIANDPFSPLIKKPTLRLMESLFENVDSELICFGHHHPIHFFQNEEKIFLNPGSLGCDHEAFAKYAIVEVSKAGFDVKLKKIPYEKEKLIKSYETLKVVERELLLKIFQGVE